MANYTEPFQAVLDYVYPKLQYNAYHNKENTLLLWLKQHCNKPVSSFGEYIRIPIQYGHTDDSTNIAASPYGTISTTALTDQDALKFQVGGFVLPIIGSNWEIEVLVGSGKNRVYDYWLTKTKTRAKAARRILSDHLFSNQGSTTTDIMGLDYIVDQDDTTYGALTRSSSNTYGLWPNEDTSTTTITWPAMENLYMDCHAEPDLFITTKDIYGFVWALRQPQERYNPSGGGKEFGNVGAPVIHFNHIPIVWDERCTANAFYMLSSNDLLYFTHSGDWDLGAEKVVDKTETQEVRVGRIKMACQLAASRCDRMGRFDSITA